MDPGDSQQILLLSVHTKRNGGIAVGHVSVSPVPLILCQNTSCWRALKKKKKVLKQQQKEQECGQSVSFYVSAMSGKLIRQTWLTDRQFVTSPALRLDLLGDLLAAGAHLGLSVKSPSEIWNLPSDAQIRPRRSLGVTGVNA